MLRSSAAESVSCLPFSGSSEGMREFAVVIVALLSKTSFRRDRRTDSRRSGSSVPSLAPAKGSRARRARVTQFVRLGRSSVAECDDYARLAPIARSEIAKSAGNDFVVDSARRAYWTLVQRKP